MPEMTDPQTLRALAAELCEAKGPRYVLDQKIHRIVMDDYFAGDNPPPYTTSLDAKLPGEDVTYVGIHPNGTWSAEDSRRAGQPARAYTEPLARRAAALLAMAATLEGEK